jgi:hypothetical protein
MNWRLELGVVPSWGLVKYKGVRALLICRAVASQQPNSTQLLVAGLKSNPPAFAIVVIVAGAKLCGPSGNWGPVY